MKNKDFIQNIVTQRFVTVYNQLINDKKVHGMSDFANKIDYSVQSLNEILKKRRDVPIEVLRKTLNLFNEINSDWLFTGNGVSISDNSINTGNSSSNNSNSVNIANGSSFTNFSLSINQLEHERDNLQHQIELLTAQTNTFKAEIDGQRKEIEGYKREISALKDQLTLKDEIIYMLKSK